MTDRASLDSITVGGGCFWCVEAAFAELRGVIRAISGYAGGHVDQPTYKQVCSGSTGHAEVVQISFDPDEISLRDILRVFFTIHDPTTLNRQGHDIGTQYRSIIFVSSQDQQSIAEEIIAETESSHIWNAPIVTEVKSLGEFFPAEEYHQDYFNLNGDQPYCRAVIAPKIDKLRRAYRERLKHSAA